MGPTDSLNLVPHGSADPGAALNTSWWRAVTRLRPAALDLRTFLKSWRTSLTARFVTPVEARFGIPNPRRNPGGS